MSLRLRPCNDHRPDLGRLSGDHSGALYLESLCRNISFTCPVWISVTDESKAEVDSKRHSLNLLTHLTTYLKRWERAAFSSSHIVKAVVRKLQSGVTLEWHERLAES